MKKKILVIDDEEDILEIAKMRLKLANYEVLTALTAEDALELLKKTLPDLILLDLLLPKMQGEELFNKIRQNERLKKIPVIVFTASIKDLEDIQKIIHADGYIKKPFDSEELLSKIKALIE